MRSLRVVHVVVTEAHAGVERYVATTARGLTSLGHDVHVIGGAREPMEQAVGSRAWAPGSTPMTAARALAVHRRCDVVHVHMTSAEMAALAVRPILAGRLVATRHFAGQRGSTRRARAAGRLFARTVDLEIAISQHVARHIEKAPTMVLPSGVDAVDQDYRADSRTVAVVSRLEAEKQAGVALDAWAAARLWREGWRLQIVGDGAERPRLEAAARGTEWQSSVSFLGWRKDVTSILADAALLLAPTPSEALGLAVLEAMSAGLPVLASASGGHLETAGALHRPATFVPGDARDAAVQLRALAHDRDWRLQLSRDGRALQRARFSTESHVKRLAAVYESLVVGAV